MENNGKREAKLRVYSTLCDKRYIFPPSWYPFSEIAEYWRSSKPSKHGCRAIYRIGCAFLAHPTPPQLHIKVTMVKGVTLAPGNYTREFKSSCGGIEALHFFSIPRTFLPFLLTMTLSS